MSGVAVASYFGATGGVAEAGRRLADALAAAGADVRRLSLIGDRLRAAAPSPGFATSSLSCDAALACVNLPDVAGMAVDTGDAVFGSPLTAGYWFWEVGAPPRRWARSAELFDELWVPSEHVAELLRPVVPAPVHKVDIPLASALPPLSHGRGSRDSGPVFLVVFDHNSGLARKNPQAAIRAYRRAFGADQGAQLIVKSINHERHRRARETLRAEIADRPDISLIEERLTAGALAALRSRCDCLVSLHRAEGLGLPLLDALACGMPVIATGWSGNLEYMDAESSLLVDFRLVPVGRGADAYPPRATWAEPDIDHAATLMRRVASEAESVAAVAQAAGRRVRERYGTAQAGAALRHRIAQIEPRRDRRRPADPGRTVRGARAAVGKLAPYLVRIAPGTAATVAPRLPVYLRPGLLERDRTDR